MYAVKTAVLLLKPEIRYWTLSMVLAVGTFGSRVRIRNIIKKKYFLQFENTVCGIKQQLSFIYTVFITFALTGGFYGFYF